MVQKVVPLKLNTVLYMVITWIREIWAELDPNLIVCSFDQCGITPSTLADHHSQIRHFLCNLRANR